MHIKSFIISDIFPDIVNLTNILDMVEYTPAQATIVSLGEELRIPELIFQPLASMINSFNKEITIDTDASGVYRKPYNTIHFEDIYDNTVMTGILAIKPTTLTFYNYIGKLPMKGDNSSVYGIDFTVEELIGEFILEELWEATETVIIPVNDIYFFRPDRFHKVESELVQMYTIIAAEVPEIPLHIVDIGHSDDVFMEGYKCTYVSGGNYPNIETPPKEFIHDDNI